MMAAWNEHLGPMLGLALLSIGVWCLATRRRAVQQVIGLNIMVQGGLVCLIDAGARHDEMELAQSMVISALVAEAIVLAITLAIVVNIYRYQPEGLVDNLDTLKG
jgi:NADH:ubiquinone oxidoreductase subunit K